MWKPDVGSEWRKQQRGIQTSSSSAGKNSVPSELNIVLIGGRHGRYEPSGKSSVGNIILGREAFRTNTLTSQSVMRQELVSGRQVSVVDTPGWRSSHPLDLTPKLTQLEIQRSVSLCPPGPHAFVLVVRLDSPYPGTGMSAEEHVRFLLSDTVWKHAIVVFTVADKNNMRPGLIRSSPELRYLTEKCEGRFHVLDISDRGDGDQVTEVTELLQKVDQIVQSNGGHYETEEHVSEELKEKERTIRRRAEQRRTHAQKQPTGPPKHIGRTDLRIVVLGRQDSGKSSAGNTILTGSGFKAGRRSVQCEVRQGSVAGRHVTVVDSPGWFYNRPLQDTSEMDRLEIQDSVSLCPPGPHAVLLAVPLREAFTKAQRVALEEHMSLLPQSLWSNSIVLFTYGDLLGERSIEQHIEAEGEDLRWLVERCGNRYHVFNNQKRDVSQVTQLLEKIDEMLSGNTGGHCEVEKMSARKRNMEERVQTLTRKLTALNTLPEGETTPSPQEEHLAENEYYTLTHNPRGTCLIINELKDRPGTLKDQDKLEKVFSKLGFEVEVRTNQTANDIRRVLKELGGQDFREADALVVCVLSHGNKGCVLGSDGKKVLLKKLMEPFRSRNAPTLAGKPKLFFIQACQGSDSQQGVLLPLPTPSGGQDDTLQEDSLSLHQEMVPDDADFLMGMSTVEDYVSFRNPMNGSIYIQELCRQLERAAVSGEDILSVLTAVNREVGRRQTYIQMPESRRNTLTKKLFLKFI